MKYKQLLQLVRSIELVIGSQETKTAKKLAKIFERVKKHHDEYQSEVEILRLDAAQTDDKDCLVLNEKGDFRFSKEGIKKLTKDIEALGEKEFDLQVINVVNQEGLQDFVFLKDWTSGIDFNLEEEEEL